MEHTSSEKISEALKLLDEAAKQKKDELTSAMSDKYTHLKHAIVETERSLVKSVSSAGKHAIDAAAHAKDVGLEKAGGCRRRGQARAPQSWPTSGARRSSACCSATFSAAVASSVAPSAAVASRRRALMRMLRWQEWPSGQEAVGSSRSSIKVGRSKPSWAKATSVRRRAGGGRMRLSEQQSTARLRAG